MTKKIININDAPAPKKKKSRWIVWDSADEDCAYAFTGDTAEEAVRKWISDDPEGHVGRTIYVVNEADAEEFYITGGVND